MTRIFFVVSLLFLSLFLSAQDYTPDWESLDTRPVPEWFSEAKFGIFIHWGLSSVPAYHPFPKNEYGYLKKQGCEAEWYIPDVMYKPELNNNFHKRSYGDDFSYFDFAKDFRTELFDPDEWVKLFSDTGAKYVILTAKNSDGYALWPSKEKYSQNRNSAETNPEKDLVEELSKSVKEAGMKMGLYYNFMEFWSTKTTIWPEDPKKQTGFYVPSEIYDKYSIPEEEYTHHIHFQTKELIKNYQPDIFWTDGELDYSSEDIKSKELLAWIYNESPNKETIVVNDRWAKGSRGKHGGFYSNEYGKKAERTDKSKAWEQYQSIGYSSSYNKAERPADYKSTNELLISLVKTIAKGGNYLLSFGPDADGRIPDMTMIRLKEIAKWMKLNNEAIFKTSPYVPDADSWTINPKAGENIFFTHNDKYKYVILTDWEIDVLNLKHFSLGKYSKISSLENKQEIKFHLNKESVVFDLPENRNKKIFIFRIENINEKPKK